VGAAAVRRRDDGACKFDKGASTLDEVIAVLD